MRDQPTPDLFDLAWAAGLFEGEGSFGYQPNSVSASLSMTDFDIVERFHAVVGVGKCTAKNQVRRGRRAGVEHVLETLRPWLGPRRTARGEEVLRLQADYTTLRKTETERACKNGHPRTVENTQHVRHSETGRMYKRCRQCANEWAKKRRRTPQLADTLLTVIPGIGK